MNNELQRAEKVLQRINELACISEDEGFIVRTYGTEAFIGGRNKVEQWMRKAGLQTSVDNIGNVRGKLLSGNKKAKTLVIASHLDTIVNAGKFDGPLGVLTGLDVVEQLKQSGIQLPFHIELVGFCDEEGCRFHTTYLGSKAIAGVFDRAVLGMKDEKGITLQEAIDQNGGDINKLDEDAIAKNEWLGYYEIHIEQGPVLYDQNIPVAVVTAIAGQYRVGIVFNGEAGHAGTVPMKMRKDALACAAEFILETEKFAARDASLVATIGKLHIINAASNVIPGEVIVSLDLRSAEGKLLADAYTTIKEICEEICRKRNIIPEWSLIQHTNPVDCDKTMTRLLSESVREAGYELTELVSGAGHDAVPVSTVSPVTMLFVKCFKGISHHPEENVESEDIAAAIKVSDNFIKRLISRYNL